MMVMLRDCHECLAHLKGASFPKKHITQSRRLPDGKWHHATREGRILHLLATKQPDK
jgi:hypothetical protein